MSKPLSWFLQLLGLVLVLTGWGSQNWTTITIGIVCVLIGASGIRNRIKEDQGKNK